MLRNTLVFLTLGVLSSSVFAADKPDAAKAAGKSPAAGTAAAALSDKDLRDAPDFTLPGSDGKSYNLSSMLGEGPVVLEWWNPECPYVKRHYDSKNMQNLQKAIAKDAKWFRVLSSAKGEQGFMDKDKINQVTKSSDSSAVVVLMDPDGKVGKLYGATNTPHMFVIGKNKKVFYEGAIDDNPRGDKKIVVDYVSPAVANAKAGVAANPIKTKAYGCSVKYAI